jgi:hypothetical protein
LDSTHLGELDKGYDNFRVGLPNVSIKSMSFGSATPGFIGIGEVANVGMEIEGIGDIPVDGTLTLEIRNAADSDRVSSWQHKFYELIPGATFAYDTDWDSSGIPGGSYQLKGWVDHDGGTTSISSATFETKRDMYWDWDEIADVYRHGEKIVGTANLRHPDGSVVDFANTVGLSVLRPNLETFIPGLTLNTMDPYYSTQFIVTALDPSGIHTLTSTASKIGYKTAMNNRWFVVTENPFALSSTPEVAIADGITPVHVESEVVREGTEEISDGTLITINPLVGSVATEDASPSLGGRQVASSGGRFSFDWLPPTTTALDGFAHAFLGGDRPQSGISVAFKGIDFNGNRRVDVADIGFVRSKESNEFGSESFDTRADLNGDDLIDATDTQEVIDRWSLEFADADPCPICTPTPKDFGVKIRPVPDRALIPPGGELTIEIVAEGLDNMAGYEFGSILVGDSLDWIGEPELNPALKTLGETQHPLGPVGYGEGGYRLGALIARDLIGVSGMITLATFTVSAVGEGETRLILSTPSIVRMDGTEQAIMQTVEGIYEVGIPTSTPTSTPTLTLTPTPSNTMAPTPTWTPGSLEGYDIFPPPDGDGKIDSGDLLLWLQEIQDGDSEGILLFDFAQFWKEPSSR